MEEKQRIQKIRQYFLAKKETIAVAESVTSGLLQVFLSNIPDALEAEAERAWGDMKR